ncbi:MAG: hypothetical protein COV59_03165 [Candidatus Magasanikbacteria bacterium CG11_big_fil_rev_8_21_14_0_20_39_34]|uniref:O-antigen ligase-related domain-containing protein n=1 Tax=Candidatus Magasanikbacteria bacterium CG11_big_fil_rev_8_21_14_0_20_39_34 TaxID=1974653 RepID=A0A2H0N5H7_9BACT|nr:MAG: hypothetical protein COV59_03165 [Candidatus Magasanikbacteria bacterium CG11_big_fil_rev_8_21_14_0_20_39_34]
MPQTFISEKICFHKETVLYILTFIGLRIFSYLFTSHDILQAIFCFVSIMLFGLLYFKNEEYAFLLLLGELLLGGSGHLFEFFGLSLRLLLLICFSLLWFLHHTLFLKTIKKFYIPHHIFHLLIALSFIVFFSFFNGLQSGHIPHNVISDTIPYVYFTFLLPFYFLLHNVHTQHSLLRLVVAFIVGSSLFSVFNFVMFSSGATVIQGPYYLWLRWVNLAKITDMGEGFFRIVLPEHFLLIPIALLLMSLLITKMRHSKFFIFLLILILLTTIIDLSRTLLLGLGIGSFVLLYRHNVLSWVKIMLFTLLISFILFVSINFTASQGKTFGFDLFTTRVTSLINPDTERSTKTRMALLPDIWAQIETSPLFGNGLGAEVTYFDTYESKEIATTQLDWGYFELLVEIGIFGAFIYLSVIILTLLGLLHKIKNHILHKSFYVGLLSGFVSLLFMNITSPALFHVFGVFFIVIIISIIMRPYHLLDAFFPPE